MTNSATITNCSISVAQPSEVPHLLAINQRWQRSNLAHLRHGFLSVAYETAFMEAAAAKGDLLTIQDAECHVQGYVLVNTVGTTARLESVKELFFTANPQYQTKNLAFGYQVVLEQCFQGTGAFRKLLKKAFAYYGEHYEGLVSTINKENTRSIKAHEAAGWDFLDTAQEFLIISKLFVRDNILSKVDQITIRLAEDGDIDDIYRVWKEGLPNSFNLCEMDESSIKESFCDQFKQRLGILNYWVCVNEDGEIIGWQSLKPASQNLFRRNIEAESSTYVRKENWNQGIGCRLLKYVAETARSSSLQYIIGYVAVGNVKVHKLLIELGWVEVGTFPAVRGSNGDFQKKLFALSV